MPPAMARLVGMMLLPIGLCCCGGGPANVRIVTGPRLGAEPVSVVVFDPPGSVISWDEPVDALGSQLAAAVVEELQRHGHAATVVPRDAEVTGVTVRGRLLRVNGGSRATRFWIGLGAGRASVSAEGTVTRGDGDVLGHFRERRSSSGEAELGFATDRYLVDKCVRVLGRDIATMLDTGEYRDAALADERP